MADSSGIETRLARAATAAPPLLTISFLPWVRRAPPAEIAVYAAGASVAVFLLMGRQGWARTFGKLTLSVLLSFNVASFYATKSGVPIDASRVSGLPHGRELLVTSVLISGCCLGFSLLEELAAGLRTAFRHLGARAGTLAYVGVLVAVVAVSSDLYFVGRGARYSLKAAQILPYYGPGSGSYGISNVLEAEVWDNRGTQFHQRKPEGVVRIVLEGASTMWGHELADDEAPAAVLRRALSARFPETRFEVIQMALKGKYLMDEMFDAVAVLPRWKPDLVISLNGFNDVPNHDSDGFEGIPFWQGQIDAALGASPLSQLLYETTHVGPVIFENTLRGSAGPASRLSRPDLYTAPRYFPNLEMTARNLRAAGIPYAFSFTPNTYELGHGTPWLVANHRYRRRISSEIVGGAGQLPFDASLPFVTQPIDAVFMDLVHLTPFGVKLFVDGLVEQIPGWLGLHGATGQKAAPLPSIQQALATVPYLDAKPNSGALTAEVGVRGTSTRAPLPVFRTTGAGGFLQSGPSIDLEPGLYVVEWYGAIDVLGTSSVDVVARSNDGRLETVVKGPVVPKHPPPIGRLASLVFALRAPAHGVEYRFQVSADSRLELERVVLIRLSPDPAGVPPPEWQEYRQ